MNLHAAIPTPILSLLAMLYAAIVIVRNRLFDWEVLRSYQSKLPVICVGNCTVGGTGKTPLVREIARFYLSRGHRPVVLTRGYGGSVSGPHQVVQSDNVALVGDEAKMLAGDAGVPVVVCRSRVDGARYIEDRNIGTVIILDDGFQHRRLKRDVNILCLNVADSQSRHAVVEGSYLPRGIFRESLADALKRTSILVYSFRRPEDNPAKAVDEISQKLNLTVPALTSVVDRARVVSATTGEELAPQQVFALCAIANPEGFLRTLSDLGFECKDHRLLADHSSLVSQNVIDILSATSLPIVMTEKDLVKIEGDLESCSQLFVVKIELKIEPRQLLDDLLIEQMHA